MGKNVRSARGELVDFDLLAIKQQLMLTPVPVGVDQRRKFIDEKDGIKTRTSIANMPSALSMAMESVAESEEALVEQVEISIEEEVVQPQSSPKGKK